MFLRILCIFLVLETCSFTKTIEYGGISFECDSGCGTTGYDLRVDEIVSIFKSTVWDAFQYRGLYDSEGTWQTFTPCSIEDEDLDYISLQRFAWEETDGKYASNFTTECFDYTSTGIGEFFARIQNDLQFYISEQIRSINRRLKLHQKDLKFLKKSKEDGYRGVQYNQDTHRVLGVYKTYSIYDTDDDDEVYCRQIDDAMSQEERGIQASLNELESPPLYEEMENVQEASRQVDLLLKEIFLNCLKRHQPEGIVYEDALNSLLTKDYFDAMEHIRHLIEIAEKSNFNHEITSKIHLLKGELQAEFGQHASAIASLTDAIAKAPSLKEAYLKRAAYYFELGEFNHAIEDFIQGNLEDRQEADPQRRKFSTGLLAGIVEGGRESFSEFVPEIIGSLRGLSNGLWAFCNDPVKISSDFANAAVECLEFIKSHTPLELAKEMIPELKELIQNYDTLTDQRKGQLMGQVIGKYGSISY